MEWIIDIAFSPATIESRPVIWIEREVVHESPREIGLEEILFNTKSLHKVEVLLTFARK